MPITPTDPVHGCSHGASMDAALQGLTLRQWYVGQALLATAGMQPADASAWAFAVADAVFATFAKEDQLNPLPQPDPQPLPTPPSQQ